MSNLKTDADGAVSTDYSVSAATRFFTPLVLQGIAQSFTYPLVASVVTHGSEGVSGYGAFAQALTIFFVMTSITQGLLTTGMLYGRTGRGFANFKKLTAGFCVVLSLSLLLFSLPPLEGIIFDKILSLSPELRKICRETVLLCIPAIIAVLYRNPYQAVLYNARASGVANGATMGRIAVTLLITFTFVKMGFVGHIPGVIALTIPMIGEAYFSWMFAVRYVKVLPSGIDDEARISEQLFFSLPISFGSFLLALSGFMVAAFISRAADPVRMLPIHYIALGLINPLALAAIRTQAVVLTFPPIDRHGSRTFRFSIGSGLVLASVTLLGHIPAVARFYFGSVQNLVPDDIVLAKRAMLAAIALPLFQSLRGHAEGLAAWRKRPNAILAGQAVYLASLVCALFFALQLDAPGYLMGAIAISTASFAAFATIRLGVAWSYFEDLTRQFVRSMSDNNR